MPKQQATEPPRPIRLTCNTILENRFFNRGEVLPITNIADLPENLKPYVVTDESAEPEEENCPRGSFQLNTIYEVTSDNRLGRALKRQIERQVAEMESAAEEQEWIAEQMDAPLPPQIAESLQEAHENSVALAAAQLAADASRADAASDAAAAAKEPAQLFVRRGSRHYAPVGSARLRPDEDVFTRQPSGRFEFVGKTDSSFQLPYLPITL